MHELHELRGNAPSGVVVVVEDDAAMRDLLVEELQKSGLHVHACASVEETMATLREVPADLVLADLNLGETLTGLDLCRNVCVTYPDVPVVILTAFGSLDTAVGAIRAGAYDFVTKPFEMQQLRLTLDRAVRLRRLQSEVERLREEVRTGPGIAELLGESEAILDTKRLVARMADSEAPVLVRGESGTGKELVARALHRGSARRDRPFVVANMAAIPTHLLESELFGHVRGAFTDAKQPREGLLLQAHGGTLVLDEVGDMPLELQPKLLRVLEGGLVRPVGSDHSRPFDARIIATTNRDLEAAIEAGDFRTDLYHRLGVLEISLPPLRARGHDVLLLAQAFLEAASARTGSGVRRLSKDVAERLLNYPWPGNVRELRNCMERCAVLARYDEVTVAELPPRVRDFEPQTVVLAHEGAHVPLAVVERQYILRVLDSVGGNKTLAARVLGVGRKTLYRKLEKYGLPTTSDRTDERATDTKD
jgi:DNA-binding NtrC family response regulator